MVKGVFDGGFYFVVVVIGDLIFIYLGMIGLLDCVNENVNVIIVILDNEIIVMIGG